MDYNVKDVFSADAGFTTCALIAAFILIAALALFATYVFSRWAYIPTKFPSNSTFSGCFTSATTNPSAWAKAAGVCHCLPDDSALIVLPFIAVYFSEST